MQNWLRPVGGVWKCKGAFSKVGEVALVLLSCDTLSLCVHWR